MSISASTIRPVPWHRCRHPRTLPIRSSKKRSRKTTRRKVGSGWAAIQASRIVFSCHPLAQVDAMRVRSRNAKTLAGARVLTLTVVRCHQMTLTTINGGGGNDEWDFRFRCNELSHCDLRRRNFLRLFQKTAKIRQLFRRTRQRFESPPPTRVLLDWRCRIRRLLSRLSQPIDGSSRTAFVGV